jgi:hypothetical protein
VFPDGGRFPFSTAEFAASLAFCILGVAFTWRVPAARVLRFVFVAYSLACAAAFVVPSAIGENVARLRFVAVPVAVLALSLRGWKPLLPAVGALVLAVSWNFTPLASSYSRGASDPSSHAAYWQPVLQFLGHSLRPSYRVEAVDTSGHWDAVFLARAGVPIARGWFRQDDFPQNRVLYGDLGRRSYLHWLRRLGVEFVVLTDAPLDYSARTEAALLRSGRSGLVPVFRSAHATVYRVPHPSPIVVGPAPARMLALRPSSAVLEVARAGTYRVAVRYTPYWSSIAACVTKAPDGMIDVVARRRGVITLRFAVTARRAVAAAAGVAKTCP